MLHKKITFIGAGNMTSSIISGLIKANYPSSLICASAPSPDNTTRLKDQFSIKISNDNISSAKWADVIVLAVKPQIMAEVCQALNLAGIHFENKLIISIAAGITVERLQSLLGDTTEIIRTMPNTPALVQKGMTGLFASTLVSTDNKLFAEQLLLSVGKIIWVQTEAMINAIIAVSGSAPAYFFLFMEAMQEKALKMGFDEQQARLLVQQVALGSAEMVLQNPEKSIATLRQNVTSKGGATAVALHMFNELDLNNIVAKAMQSASDRANDMESLF